MGNVPCICSLSDSLGVFFFVVVVFVFGVLSVFLFIYFSLVLLLCVQLHKAQISWLFVFNSEILKLC